MVSTPIGNLEDLSARARGVLSSVAAVVCEDTRVTRKLIAAHGIDVALTSFHAHSSDRRTLQLVERLVDGQDLALVADAGTPLMSDPGAELVEAALKRGLSVVPIPGPSALLAALVGAGVPCQPFVFLGFLPRNRSDQRELLGPLAPLSLTLVLYEAPARLAETLRHLAEICGERRQACVARELTKRFETFERGCLGDLAERFQGGTRGELVVVIGPPDRHHEDARPVGEDQLRNEARRLLESGSAPSEVARILAGAFGLPKRRAYRAVLDVARAQDR